MGSSLDWGFSGPQFPHPLNGRVGLDDLSTRHLLPWSCQAVGGPKSKWGADKAGTSSGAPKSPRVESMETQAQSKRQKMLPRNIQGASVRKKNTFREPLVASEKRMEAGGRRRTLHGIDPDGRHPGKERKPFLLPSLQITLAI